MGRIILSDIALNGVKEARVVKKTKAQLKKEQQLYDEFVKCARAQSDLTSPFRCSAPVFLIPSKESQLSLKRKNKK